MKRRRTAALLVVLTASALAACSTGSAAEKKATPEARSSVDANAFPVTIEHAFGSTTIEAEPQRVATIGWAEHDFVLGLGVVPVGASRLDWGANHAASTPWFDAELKELGGEAPTRYDDADGIAFDAIAELEPDVILSTYWNMTKKDHRRLSRIAPVVAFPEAGFTTTWQQSLELIGKALGRTTAAQELADQTERAVATAAAEHPELVGRTFLYAAVAPTDLSKLDYLTEHDPRSSVLMDLGMELVPAVARMAEGNSGFFGSVSAERADTLESDLAILMPYDDSLDDSLEKLVEEHALLGQIPAVERGTWYPAVDQHALLALSAPSPLSLPWAMRGVIPDIADAATP